MASIKIRNLSKIYGSPHQIEKAKTLVNQGLAKEDIVEQTGATVGVYDASFDIHEGETFVVMGLSGSGKSTLLRMLNRLIEPTNGDVYIDDVNVTKADSNQLREVRRKKISMVFQSFALFPHRTLLENVAFGLEIQGIDKDEQIERARKALDTMSLLPYQDQYPHQLSGGMQQRVGLARALASDTEILLMDEAFSALDPLIRRDMQDELLRLQKTLNKTIVFITHDLDEALRLGDRIALMRNGHVVQIGTGEEILENPANDYVEKFVENVDRAKVFTAEHAMEEPKAIINKDRTGARMTLRIMRDMHLSHILVIDDNRHLLGYVKDNELARHINRHQAVNRLTIDEIIHTDYEPVHRDTPIKELFDVLGGAFLPVAVVDDHEQLIGYVNRRMVIDQLSQEDQTTNSDDIIEDDVLAKGDEQDVHVL